MAPALLCLLAMTVGCLNPTLYDEPQIEVNHAPTLDDIDPAPDFNPREVNFGEGCRTETFRGRVDDVDRDVLTVRFNIIIPRGNPPLGARVLLDEKALAPLEDPPAIGPFYDLPPFELSQTLLLNRLGSDFDRLVAEENFQLLELRISDGDFIAGTEEVPQGRAQFVATWAINLIDVDCTSGGL